MRILVIAVVLLGQVAQPPDTEIFLASLSVQGGRVEIGKPVNVSNNAGYDNQPSFTPDGTAVLFTSVRGDRKPDPANSAATGSDIFKYDIASQKLSQVTNTPEAEYSPTVTPDGGHISVIRVEADGTQRLWRFTTGGKQPELVLRDGSGSLWWLRSREPGHEPTYDLRPVYGLQRRSHGGARWV